MSLIFGRLSLAMLLVAILVIARFTLGIHMRRFASEIVTGVGVTNDRGQHGDASRR